MEFDPKTHNLEVEKLQLLDISSEDDFLIDFPFRNSLEDLRLSVTFEKTNPRDGFKQLWNADNESEIHQQRDYTISEFSEPKRPSFLRRSLAWDSEFFTSEGVLDPEELFVINKGFKKSEVPPLPIIQENLCGCRSADSKSTLTASKKMTSGSQNKLKSVSASKSESIKQRAVVRPNNSQRTTRSKEIIMSSPKPPKILSPAYLTSAKQREMDHKARKTRSGPDLKVSKKSRLGDLSVPITNFTPPHKSDSSLSFSKDSTACCSSYDSGSRASSSSKYSSKSNRTGINSRNATTKGSYLVYNVIKSLDLQKSQEIDEGKFTSHSLTRASRGTGSVSAVSKRTGKSSGLRKPSPKIGFFDEDRSMQPVVSGRVGFNLGKESPIPNISGPTSEKRTSRFRPAKTLPDPDVSPVMEIESSSNATKNGLDSGLMKEKLHKKVFLRNKMSSDRIKENDNTGYVQGGPTNSFLKKNKEREKEKEKENICNYEDEVSGLSRYFEGVDLNRDVVIEQIPSSRTPLADKTCLSNRGGLFGLSMESTNDNMLFEKPVLHLQDGMQKEKI